MGSTFRKGSKESGQSGGISNLMSGQGGELADLALSLFRPAAGQLKGFLEGGAIPQALTGAIGTQEQELASAKQGILASGARGGQLNRSLTELPMRRLMMRDQLRGDIFNTALGLGGNLGSLGFGAQGNAAANLNALGAQRQQQNMAFQGGLGQLVGSGLGFAASKCWIAERLYGRENFKTLLLRHWFTYRVPGWWVSRLYGMVGLWASRQRWVWYLRPLFERFLLRAMKECYGNA